jgi:hypothetical protein
VQFKKNYCNSKQFGSFYFKCYICRKISKCSAIQNSKIKNCKKAQRVTIFETKLNSISGKDQEEEAKRLNGILTRYQQ